MTKSAAGIAFALVFAACGGGAVHPDGGDASATSNPVNGRPTIQLGVPVKGTVESTDRHYYVIGPPPISGFEDVYQIEVTAGTIYTVSCTGDFILIEDPDSGGEFTTGSMSSIGMTCFDSPAAWNPRRTGFVTINVLAAADEVPTSYTMTFSK
jgi:hypothetical protein